MGFAEELGTDRNVEKLKTVMLAYCEAKNTSQIQGAPILLTAVLLQVYKGKFTQVDLTFRSLMVVMAEKKYGALIDNANFLEIAEKLREKLRVLGKSFSRAKLRGIAFWITQQIQSGLFNFPGIPEHVIWRLWDRYIASGCDNDLVLDFCVQLFRANKKKVKKRLKRPFPFALADKEIFFTKKHFEKALEKAFQERCQHRNFTGRCQVCDKKKLRKFLWWGNRHTCRLCGNKIRGTCSLYLEKVQKENRICKSCAGENSKPKVQPQSKSDPRQALRKLLLPKPHWLPRGAIAGA